MEGRKYSNDELKGQHWYMDMMTALGYEPPQNGICYAIGHLGMSAALLKSSENFDVRIYALREIYNKCKNRFDDEIKISAKNDETISLNEKYKLFTKIIQEEFQKLDKKIKTDILAFFDLIEVEYYLSTRLSFLMPSEKINELFSDYGLNANASSKLMDSIAAEKKGGLVKLGKFSSSSLKKDIPFDYKNYFDDLVSVAKKFQSGPLGLLITSHDSNHTISVTYYPEEDYFVLIEAENLPSMIIKNTSDLSSVVNEYLFSTLDKDTADFFEFSPLGINFDIFALNENYKPCYEASSIWIAKQEIYQAKHISGSQNDFEINVSNMANHLDKIIDQCNSSDEAISIGKLVENTKNCFYKIQGIKQLDEYPDILNQLNNECEKFSDIKNINDINMANLNIKNIDEKIEKISHDYLAAYFKATQRKNIRENSPGMFSIFNQTIKEIGDKVHDYFNKKP